MPRARLSCSSSGPALFWPGLTRSSGPGCCSKTSKILGENWTKSSAFSHLGEWNGGEPGLSPAKDPHPGPLPASGRGMNARGLGPSALRSVNEAGSGDGAPVGAEVGGRSHGAWTGNPGGWLWAKAAPDHTLT